MKQLTVKYEKPKSFGMPVEAYIRLKLMAKESNRTMASMIMELIDEKADQLNIPKVVVTDRPSVGRPKGE